MPVGMLDPEGNDDGLSPVTAGGTVVWGTPTGGGGGGDPLTYGEPMATVIDGKPELVFDADGGLVWTETI